MRDLIAALRERGFEALGVKVEKIPLRPRIRELAFVAAERRCYASVAGPPQRSRLYYYTPLPTGMRSQSRDEPVNPEARSEWRAGVV